jgi:hypothetical protein
MDILIYLGIAILLCVFIIPITLRLLEIHLKTKYLSPEEAKKKMEEKGFHFNDHPKPLQDIGELEAYRKNCPLKCHPNGQCSDNGCHASDYYYNNQGKGQWYCRASPTLEEFEPDYRRKEK